MDADEQGSPPPGPRPPGVPPPAGSPPPGESIDNAVASALRALASSQEAMRSTRDALNETREAVARTRGALTQSAAELRRAAELSARDLAGERLSRAESRALTRERLLDAAAEVFNRLGYHGASLEAVAEAAGYTKGAVYSNFATKGDLFIALQRRHTMQRTSDQLAVMANLTLEQLADQGAIALLEQARSQESWNLLQIEFWLAAMRDPELRAAMAHDNDEFWTEIGARFDEKFEGAGLHPPFTGVEFAKLVNAFGSGLLLELGLDPGYVEPGLFSRAIRVLAGMPPGAP